MQYYDEKSDTDVLVIKLDLWSTEWISDFKMTPWSIFFYLANLHLYFKYPILSYPCFLHIIYLSSWCVCFQVIYVLTICGCHSNSIYNFGQLQWLNQTILFSCVLLLNILQMNSNFAYGSKLMNWHCNSYFNNINNAIPLSRWICYRTGNAAQIK